MEEFTLITYAGKLYLSLFGIMRE